MMSSMICAAGSAARDGPGAAPGEAWSQGVGLGVPAESVGTDRADGFDWRGRRQRLNRYYYCIADIDGIRFHFVSHRGHGESAPAHPAARLAEQLRRDAALGRRRLGDWFDLGAPLLPWYAFSFTASVDRSRPGVRRRGLLFAHGRDWAIHGMARTVPIFCARSGHLHGAVPSGEPRRHTPQHCRYDAVHRARRGAPFAGPACTTRGRCCLGLCSARRQLGVHSDPVRRLSDTPGGALSSRPGLRGCWSSPAVMVSQLG